MTNNFTNPFDPAQYNDGVCNYFLSKMDKLKSYLIFETLP